MSKKQETLTINKRVVSQWLAGLVVLVIVVLGWLGWHGAYQNSTQVFWGMIDNNFATASVVKHDVGTQQGVSTNQYVQIQFGALSAAHSLATVKQQNNTVTSETIGTSKNDYSRYISILTNQKTSSGKKVDTSKFTGIWGKTADAAQGQAPAVQYFQQGLLGIVPYGNFNSGQRHDLVKLAQSNDTYSLGQVKTVKSGGRTQYVYDVNINQQALVKLLEQYAIDLGLGNIGLNPAQYAGSPPVQAQFTVDKLSRQLVEIHYTSNNQDEFYSSQGLEQPITLPTKTIPIADLQSLVVQSLK